MPPRGAGAPRRRRAARRRESPRRAGRRGTGAPRGSRAGRSGRGGRTSRPRGGRPRGARRRRGSRGTRAACSGRSARAPAPPPRRARGRGSARGSATTRRKSTGRAPGRWRPQARFVKVLAYLRHPGAIGPDERPRQRQRRRRQRVRRVAPSRPPLGVPHLLRPLLGRRPPTSCYRQNLAKGQTGLSVAFDLPTQTGVDSDHPLARGEVGKVGVPIGHVDDMQALFAGIPLDRMNTSMTINATAAWLLALYVGGGGAQRRRRRRSSQGTTQNDIIKEYLSRGTYIFPPEPSLRLISDMIAYTVRRDPEVEPDQRLLVPPAGGGGDARRRRSRTRWPTRSPCSTRCARAATCPPTRSRAWSGASRSS